MPHADIRRPLHLPFQTHTSLAQHSHLATARSSGTQTSWASERPGGLVKTRGAGPRCQFPLGSSGVEPYNVGFSQVPQSGCQWSGAHFENHWHGHCLPSKYALLNSHRAGPTALQMGEKFCSCVYITPQFFEKWKANSVWSPTQPWQNKAHLISGACLAPPTFILAVSFCLSLCTDGQDCVYVYTSPALLVYMYTFVFLLLPH